MSQQSNAPEQISLKKLKTLNEAGTDGFDALDGCPACGPQYGVWTINSGDVTREEALNMFTALYDDDHVVTPSHPMSRITARVPSHFQR